MARVGRGGRGAIGGFGAWHDHVRSGLDGRGETLKRIAPFVSAKNASPAEVDAMYRQMVEIVRSEGGFAQHAVVVTSDSRYLGEVPFASW
ncbi:MAG TPA: hypothetical protein VHJ76_01575 [Actinomycetota bacterium]|nr:hypothetical protein [Actinomycetota bacterium]